MSILDRIVDNRKKEVQRLKRIVPIDRLKESIYYRADCLSLKKYLLNPSKTGIIAEYKRASPSRGMINKHSRIEEVSIGYMQASSSALSVLTEETHFSGSNQDLRVARTFNYCPILRKDFIVDAYQIVEARSIGADAILLIASVLSAEDLRDLYYQATDLGMEVLFEVHDPRDVEKLPEGASLIGVNNRALKSMEVSLQVSRDLIPYLPSESLWISESGIRSAEDVIALKELGYKGFLIGSLFMEEEEPHKACLKFSNKLFSLESKMMQV